MEGPVDSDSILPQILLIIVLTFLNAIFAATEMAVVSLNENKIRADAEEGDERAKTLLNIMKDQTKFLSTIQVGITFAGFLSSASASTNMSTDLAMEIMKLGVPASTANGVAVVIITLIISYISLVFGELVPKRIALQNSERVALNVAGFINFLSKILGPFSAFLSFSTKLVLKIIGQYSEDIEKKISEEELKSYISVGQEQGVINTSGKDMMINIFEFDDSAAHEIMTPRTDMYMIEYDEFDIDAVNEILKSGYSRIPIYKENPDDVVGIVYVKDLFVEMEKNCYKNIDIDKVMTAPYFVPESKKIDQLLTELQNSKNYVALLVDEYGGLSGMVTIEDIVEEIVGEIEDEYDTENGKIEEVGDNIYLIDGQVELKTINDKLYTELESENHETIGGLIIENLGYFPNCDDKIFPTIDKGDYKMEIKKMGDNRVDEVLLTIKKKPEQNEKDEEED